MASPYLSAAENGNPNSFGKHTTQEELLYVSASMSCRLQMRGFLTLRVPRAW